MTKKHFEAIAAIVRANSIKNPAAGYDEGFDAGVAAMAADLANMFAAENPRFNRDKFLTACGF